MSLDRVKDFLAAHCDSGNFSRILNYDQSGRTFVVLPFVRRSGVQQVSVLSKLHVGDSGDLEASIWRNPCRTISCIWALFRARW